MPHPSVRPGPGKRSGSKSSSSSAASSVPPGDTGPEVEDLDDGAASHGTSPRTTWSGNRSRNGSNQGEPSVSTTPTATNTPRSSKRPSSRIPTQELLSPIEVGAQPAISVQAIRTSGNQPAVSFELPSATRKSSVTSSMSSCGRGHSVTSTDSGAGLCDDAEERRSVFTESSHVLREGSQVCGSRALERGSVLLQKACTFERAEGDYPHTPRAGSLGIGKITMRQRLSQLIETRSWQTLFMICTVYALFSTDIDQLCGTKESKFLLSIVTTVVFFLFGIELWVQSYAKPGYLFRAYFWLDLVAVISLLPDTWIMQAMTNNSQFAAARSSKISRMVRLVSKSAKATRLNRLTRIVRVAALMPRIAAAIGNRSFKEEIRVVMERKLFTVFNSLDEDSDGWITQEMLAGCLARYKAEQKDSGLKRAFIPIPSNAKSPAKSSGSLPSFASSLSAAGDKSIDTMSDTKSTETMPPSKSNAQQSEGARSEVTTTTGYFGAPNPQAWDLEEDQLVGFEDFRRIIMEEEFIKNQLLHACKQAVMTSNNMQMIASRHSEDLGVKVALGVLLLLLVLSVVEPLSVDDSDILGLQHIDMHVRMKHANWSSTEIPEFVRQHVEVWGGGVGTEEDSSRELLYLDVRHRVYCNEFALGGGSCTPGRPLRWSTREGLQQIDLDLVASHHRLPGDLVILRLPTSVADAETSDLSEEELNEMVTTLAILGNRKAQEKEALNSIITTGLVIIVILLGIVLLTRDMTYLSRSLMKPLRTLAEEMRCIAQFQLACLAEDKAPVMHTTAEINLIQQIFDNMKKAIKSWGKYVPWPVVQLLLASGIEAEAGVAEEEVTIFFSDIASFTTIVENLPPESSLLLLSRYFNDMSKVIDDHAGIVIEFIGDAILAVYGSPVKDEAHASSAVRATLKMLKVLDKLNEWAAGLDLPVLKVRCGVHTGKVLIGNMGFQSRMKYGVVGENAHIASRLEELNKNYGTSMLISHDTLSHLKRLKKSCKFVVRPIDWLYLRKRGKVEPVYHVLARDRLGKPHMLRAVASTHVSAMKKYASREFLEAAEEFAKVNDLMKELQGTEDMPALLMIQRSLAYAKRPPKSNWDGVWDQPAEPS